MRFASKTQAISALTFVVTLTAGLVAGCSDETLEQPATEAPRSKSTVETPLPTLVIEKGTKVNIGGRIAEVHGHDDHLCGGPIEFMECKVMKVEPGNHSVTLVAKDAQDQFVQWDEVWQVSKVEMPNGNRLKITRPNGTPVRSAR